ncbi:MAG: C4-dicarboxylate transporter DcuC [Negativicutes bacterium]|nr:C4-dicarboxylate transporter DcuC [Negativicutes bacterium]
MIIIGLVVIPLTIYLLIKQFETRMTLFISGLIMCTIAGTPMNAFDAFAERMVTAPLIQAICSVMGFAFVMKVSECDKHLIHLVSTWLMKARPLLIIGAVMATFAVNTALPSAAGAGAAVGPILIPLLVAAGITPATAASAVLAGTFGCMLSPGLSHNAFVAKIANVPVLEVISFHYQTSVIAGLIGAVSLTLVAFLLKEDGRDLDGKTLLGRGQESGFKIKIMKAVVPLVPITLLIIGAAGFFSISVPAAMLIGTLLGVLVSCITDGKTSKAYFETATKAYFDGMANGFGNILGIVIAASVFVQGMMDLGLVKAAIDAMLASKEIVKYASLFGPFLLAVVSGSGDAAALAFNGAITPQAQQFGYGIINMGSLAILGGQLGRTMSPLAGVTVILAAMAGVSPIDVAKRNIPGMIIAAFVCIFMLS